MHVLRKILRKQVIHMQTGTLLRRVGAVVTAIALTIGAAWYAAVRAEKNALQTNSSSDKKQVIILDAGHGGST